MLPEIIVIVVLCVINDVWASLSPCPVLHQECACYDNTLHCYGRKLTEVPTFRRTYAHGSHKEIGIDLRHNRIKTLPPYAFARLFQYSGNTVDINLNDNPITFVDNATFHGLQSQKVILRLLGTNLSSLPVALGDMETLIQLTIDLPLDTDVMAKIGKTLTNITLYAQGPDWPSGLSFAHNLQGLDLNTSMSTSFSFPSNAFAGFESSLRSLVFNTSYLNQTPNALCNLRNLTQMKLRVSYASNDASVIPICQQPFQSLTYLRIYRTPSLTLDWLSDTFPNLHVLYMTYCNLTGLPADMMLSNLTLLSLKNNRFTNVPAAISNFDQLDNLDLSDNEIDSLLSDSFKQNLSLSILDLSSNPITYIAEDAFSNLPNLYYLDLRSTSLSELPRFIAHMPKVLYNTKIYLYHNKIICSCDLKWAYDFFSKKDIHVHLYALCDGERLDVKQYLVSVFENECLSLHPLG